MSLTSSVIPSVRERPLDEGAGEDEQLDARQTAEMLNREIVPTILELRRQFNFRHGATRTVAADLVVGLDDEVLICAAGVTITLQPASTWKRFLIIKNASIDPVTVVAAPGDKIDFVDTLVIPAPFVEARTLVPDGFTNYYVVGGYP